MSHEDQKNFTCDICTKSYKNPRQLYAHRALHLGKRFLCNRCGYKARSSANLRGHIRNRHEATRFSCDICSRVFKSNSNLKSHRRIHTGETPFQCELCGVRFKRNHHLNSHLETKGHLEVMAKARRDGFRIPTRLDPLRRQRGRATVEDGPITLVAEAGFETEVETTTAATVGAEDVRLERQSSSPPFKSTGEPLSPLAQVVVLEEKCTELVDTYIIPDTHIEIIQQ